MLSYTNFHLIFYVLHYLFCGEGAHVPWHTCRGLRKTYRSQLFPSTMFVSWIEPRSSSLVGKQSQHSNISCFKIYMNTESGLTTQQYRGNVDTEVDCVASPVPSLVNGGVHPYITQEQYCSASGCQLNTKAQIQAQIQNCHQIFAKRY